MLAMLMAMPSLLFAQSANYKQPMSISATGQIKDGAGKAVGTVSKDRMIMDATGKKNCLRRWSRQPCGCENRQENGKNGKTYMDANGDLMFTFKDNADNTCDIFDAKGTKIGNVHDSYKGSACALHCFQAGHTAHEVSQASSSSRHSNTRGCRLHPYHLKQ